MVEIIARRVRVANGHKHRMLDNRVHCMPGDEIWLVGECRSTGEQKYYVSNLPTDTSLKMLAATIKARWICEQAHQQLKEELGLDHFEGKSWTSLHRHALMTMIAYAFLQSRRLKAAGRRRKDRGPTAPAKYARNQASHSRPFRKSFTQMLPHCENSLPTLPNLTCQSSASGSNLTAPVSTLTRLILRMSNSAPSRSDCSSRTTQLLLGENV